MNKAFRNTLRDILGDGALIIFMVVVPIVYPLVYALIYNPETVHEVPVAVVDCAGNATSRDFLTRLDASPDVRIAVRPSSLEAAKALWPDVRCTAWYISPKISHAIWRGCNNRT